MLNSRLFDAAHLIAWYVSLNQSKSFTYFQLIPKLSKPIQFLSEFNIHNFLNFINLWFFGLDNVQNISLRKIKTLLFINDLFGSRKHKREQNEVLFYDNILFDPKKESNQLKIYKINWINWNIFVNFEERKYHIASCYKRIIICIYMVRYKDPRPKIHCGVEPTTSNLISLVWDDNRYYLCQLIRRTGNGWRLEYNEMKI